MAETFRLFIGMWDEGDPDWTHVDERNLTWLAAKERLAARLKGFEDDTCPDCKEQAAKELARLHDAQPGAFEAEVEGEDYLIIPS